MKKIDKSELVVEIGLRVRARRQAIGMTQDELANRTGYTRTSIVKIEGGEIDMPATKLIAVAKALDISSEYILFGEEEGNE